MNRIKSILSKCGRHNINIDKIEAVSNKTGSVIFSLFYSNSGREPYNEYFLLIKKKIYFITAETFWNVKTEKNIKYLDARFHYNDDTAGYKQLVDKSIQKATIELSCMTNDALRSLTDGEYRFCFKYIDKFRQNLRRTA
ncbi:MAG: hypothetical protein ACU84J_16155 [Gammaproteobacteria bacterium]